MRIKIILWLIIVLSISVIAVEIKDVKPSSDIYDHVIKVIEAGIMKVDDKGYFNGSLLVTRYDLAAALSRLLDKVSIEAISKITQQMFSLQKLPNDLKEIDQRVKRIESQLSKIDLQELMKRIENLKTELSAQIDTLESNLEYVKGYNSFVDAVNKSINSYVARVEEQNIRLTANEKNLSKVATMINKLNDDMSYVFKEIEKINSKMISFETLKEDLEGLSGLKVTVEASITNLENFIQEIKTDMKQQNIKIEGTIAKTRMISDLSEKMAEMNDELSNMKRIIVSTNDSMTLVASDVKNIKIENKNLKLENQNLKKEIETLKKGIWYSVIAGIAGVSLGTLALILVWQSGT